MVQQVIQRLHECRNMGTNDILGSCCVKTSFHSVLCRAVKWVTEGLRDTGQLCSTNCDRQNNLGRKKCQQSSVMKSWAALSQWRWARSAEEAYRENQMLRRACWAASTWVMPWVLGVQGWAHG